MTMKSAYEKARDFFEATNLQYVDTDVLKLERLLKEQDRDTRHACAEAILQCEDDVSGECIWKDDAHSAVMNCLDGLGG